jgi:hypothetical protein
MESKQFDEPLYDWHFLSLYWHYSPYLNTSKQALFVPLSPIYAQRSVGNKVTNEHLSLAHRQGKSDYEIHCYYVSNS